MKTILRQCRIATCSALLVALAAGPVGAEDPTNATPMSETLRSGLHNVVVLPINSPTAGALTGSYGRQTDGLIGGADRGGRIGRGVSTDIGGVTVRFPIPILTIPGMIFGGLTGGTKRRIQDFRDALTQELAESAGTHLTNDALASDVFWNIRNVPSLKPKVLALSTPVPPDTDAVLYVTLSSIGINVEEDTAIITTTAHAALQRVSDGVHIFERDVTYEDTDKLKNWTKNDNAAWQAYANYARHFIGREISAQVFDRIERDHELQPVATDSVKAVKKDNWRGKTKTLTPTLAWEFDVADATDVSSVAFDVEVYDAKQMVYSANDVSATEHTVEFGMEACKTYRWTVRPRYSIGTDRRFGEWMRANSNEGAPSANVGRAASEAAAYIQDFALLEVKCGSR